MHTEDKVSISLVMLATFMILYFEIFYNSPPDLEVAKTLLPIGIVLQILVWGKIHRDTTLSRDELTNIIKYSLIALLSMLFFSYVVFDLFLMSSVSTLSIQDQIIHSQIYAITEEVFFRGAVLGFIFWILPKMLRLPKFLGTSIKIPREWIATILTALIFGFYHVYVYGVSASTLYIIGAGAILGLVVVYTKRISPAILAHMGNNFYAVMIVTGAWAV
jgi:membrane protease YdiL (CAAX protease family)